VMHTCGVDGWRLARSLVSLAVLLVLVTSCQLPAGAPIAAPPRAPDPPTPVASPSPSPASEGRGAPFLDSLPAQGGPVPAPDPAPPAPAAAPAPAPSPEPPPASVSVPGRPWWLGTRPLPLRPDGLGVVGDTPPELRDRRLPPGAPLPVPGGEVFEATIERVPADILRRSTWSPGCPVAVEDLRYVRLPFWGFDDQPHGGELLVNASVAEDVVAVFRVLFETRFPIEDMRIVAGPDVVAPPTGDGNNTTAFTCRNATGGTRWSEHAYGLAIDINPFHNPYIRGDVLIPELSRAYTDREWLRPGMVAPGDEVTEAFALIGWGWGGNWRTSKDWMHFSATGN